MGSPLRQPDGPLRLTRLALGPYGTNVYVLVCQQTGHSLLVDAPDEADKIVAELSGTALKYIVLTHNHFDHTGALAEVRARFDAPVAGHPADAAGLPCPVEMELSDGDVLTIGNLAVTVLHTPGHTPGSICLLVGNHLLAGDTLFPGGPGHTSSPSDFVSILASITRQLLPLPNSTLVNPGHGLTTTIGAERPAITGFAARPHRTGLCGDVLWLSS